MNKTFHYHPKLANENISVCCFSTTQGINIRRNRLKTGEKLTITSSITKDSYIRSSILLFRHHRQCIRLYFGWLETQFFESKLGGWKDFMFRNNKFPDFVHPHNLFEYFQNKAIDSNNTFWKRQNTKGSIKKHTAWKIPNTEFFLVRIFLYSDWVQENTDRKKPRIWTVSMQLQPFLNRGSKKFYSLHHKKKEGTGRRHLCSPPCFQFYHGNWR